MDTRGLQNVIRELSPLELAILVCLIADQHCIIAAPEELLSNLEIELQLSIKNTFDLSCAIIECSPSTTNAEFGDGVVVDMKNQSGDESPQSDRKASIVAFSNHSDPSHPSNTLDGRKVANVVIARNLDRASHLVQVQALELMRSRRSYSRTTVHITPKRFLFIALLSSENSDWGSLTPHLNDHFFISHHHNAADDLPRLSANEASETASISSQTSVVRHRSAPATAGTPYSNPVLSEKALSHLQATTAKVRTTAEIRRYTHNIVSFMRLHRAVAGGVSALSSRHFSLLTRILPPLHNLTYTTPSHIALAARKVFPHRIMLATPHTERSLQWGSSAEAVAQALRGVTADGVVEDVLGEVECPL